MRLLLLFSLSVASLASSVSAVKCGKQYGICTNSLECCSKSGNCGKTEKFCQVGCQSMFSHPLSICEGPKPTLAPAEDRGRIIESCDEAGTLSITFDDGIHEDTLPILRDFVMENKEPSFFINGVNLKKNEINFREYLKMMMAANYPIGNHLYEHKRTSELSREALARQLCMNDKVISQVVGKAPRLFRPPFRNLPEQQLKWVLEWGYIIVNFNLNPQDWKHHDTELSLKIYKDTLTPTESKQFSYISNQHDPEISTPPMVPRLLKAEYLKGWKVVNVGECIGLPNPADWYREFPWGKDVINKEGEVISFPAC